MENSGRYLILVLAAVLALTALAVAPVAVYAADAPAMMVASSSTAVQFRADMRRLWEDHIIYTRGVIISVAAGLPDADAVSARLMQNQVDIGNAVKPYYGDAAGEKLTALLKEHINGAGQVLGAAKAGDQDKLAAAQKAWYANANEIAAFLNGANPDNWPLADLQGMMKTHLDTTTAEAVARLKGDWAGDLAAFDKVQTHILMMSDALSLGIIQQFPAKFAEAPDAQVSMNDNAFDPQEVTVAAGSTVVWTNQGEHPHNVTADTGGGPKSGTIQPGESYQWVVPAGAVAGAKYFYHCSFHAPAGDGTTLGPNMSGVVIVK
ncbi:MAG TPA: cupredoxin domain-containing protein [Armatimonadota bacterium]|jgi:plastocyanin